VLCFRASRLTGIAEHYAHDVSGFWLHCSILILGVDHCWCFPKADDKLTLFPSRSSGGRIVLVLGNALSTFKFSFLRSLRFFSNGVTLQGILNGSVSIKSSDDVLKTFRLIEMRLGNG